MEREEIIKYLEELLESRANHVNQISKIGILNMEKNKMTDKELTDLMRFL